jgi:acyl carrier protein
MAEPLCSQLAQPYGIAIATPKPKTAADIQAWLVLYLANLLQVDPDEIDVTLPFDSYSLDSAGAIGLSGDIEQWLGCQCEPTLLYDYPTIEALTKYLANSLFSRKSSAEKTA